MRLAPALPGVGRPVRVLAALRNTGGVDLDGLTVRLDVDGVTRGEQRLAVPAGATREAEFATRFDAPGDHVLRVWLDAAAAGDAVPADDDFRLALDVPRTLPVLLVAGETARPFPENPADFLQLALDPAVASPAIELSSLLRPRVVSAAAFGGTSLDGARVVVLANVPRLGEAQTALLRDFVEKRRRADRLSRRPLRPPPTTTPSRSTRPSSAPPVAAATNGTARAGDPPYSYPPLLPWNDAGNGSLAEATIRRWFALGPKDFAESDNAAAAPEVVARLDTGEPMLVQRGVGRGVVIMAATSAAADWSDLPLRAAYLPLAQQLVTYAAARATPPHTVATGRPLVGPAGRARRRLGGRRRARRPKTRDDPPIRRGPVVGGVRPDAAPRPLPRRARRRGRACRPDPLCGQRPAGGVAVAARDGGRASNNSPPPRARGSPPGPTPTPRSTTNAASAARRGRAFGRRSWCSSSPSFSCNASGPARGGGRGRSP